MHGLEAAQQHSMATNNWPPHSTESLPHLCDHGRVAAVRELHGIRDLQQWSGKKPAQALTAILRHVPPLLQPCPLIAALFAHACLPAHHPTRRGTPHWARGSRPASGE